eukprot:SAG31_NODE_30104_length_385_cov_0.898601_1_plen_94_part_01
MGVYSPDWKNLSSWKHSRGAIQTSSPGIEVSSELSSARICSDPYNVIHCVHAVCTRDHVCGRTTMATSMLWVTLWPFKKAAVPLSRGLSHTLSA